MRVMILEDMNHVRQECCNLVANICIGMTNRGTLWREAGKCLIAEGKLCQYYSESVFPLLEKQRKKERKRWK